VVYVECLLGGIMTAYQKDVLSVTGCRDWPRAVGMKLSYYACNVVAYSTKLLVERQVALYYCSLSVVFLV
jgi:hypothetical protein